MFSATDWMLKRVLKSVLKKTVGRYLQSEPDLDQLDVQLSKGTFELRNVLLNCDAVNAQLALAGWCISAGYIGLVKGAIPLTANSSSSGGVPAAAAAGSTLDAAPANITVDEVLLTVTHCPHSSSSGSKLPAAAAGGSSSGTAQNQQQQIPNSEEEFGLLGQVGVLDGIKLIAGGLESMLQRLSVAATNVTIRLEVPAATSSGSSNTAAAAVGAEVVLRLDSVQYFDATPGRQQQQQQQHGQPTAARELVKCVSVTGLTLELLDLPNGQFEDEQAKYMASSQLLSTSTLQQQQQQQQQQHSNATAATGASFRNSFMSRSYMSSMRTSFMATHAAAAAGSSQQQQQQGQEVDNHDGLLLFGPSSQQGVDLKVELRLAMSAGFSDRSSLRPGADRAQKAGFSHSSSGSSSSSSSQAPCVTVDVSSSAVNFAVHPWQLPLMGLLAAAAPKSSNTPAAAAAAGGGGSSAAANPGIQQQQQQQDWGHRSFVEELFFPHCEGLVAESLGASGLWQQQGLASSSASLNPNVKLFGSGLMGDAGSGLYNSVITQSNSYYHSQYNNNSMPSDSVYNSAYGDVYNSSSSSSSVATASGGLYSVYQDARSVFGNGSSSSSTASAAQGFRGHVNRSFNAESAAQHMQQQQRGPAAAAAAVPTWSIRACVPAVTISLYYHVPSCQAAAAAAASLSTKQQQQSCEGFESDSVITYPSPPGLLIHCNGFVTSLDIAGRGCHITLKCYCFEVTEVLPICWTSGDPQLQGLSPRDVGAIPRLVPAVQGTTGFVQQAPAFVASGATAHSTPSSSSSSVQTWPILIIGGSPLEPGRGLPAVQRPSVTTKGSLHYKDTRRSELLRAALDCELLPVTLWITTGFMQRLATLAGQQQQQQRGVTPQQQQQQQGSIAEQSGALPAISGSCAPDHPHQQQRQHQKQPGGFSGADSALAAHVARICIILPLVRPAATPAAAAAAAEQSGAAGHFLVVDLHAAASSSSSSKVHPCQQHHHYHHHHHRQQQPGMFSTGAAAAASPRVLPLLRVVSAPPSAATAAAAAAVSFEHHHQQQQQQHQVVIEGSLTRLRLFYVTQVPRSSSSSNGSSGSGGLAAAAAKVAAAASAAVVASASSGILPQQQQQQQGYSLNRLLRKQQHTGSSSSSGRTSSGSSSSNSVKYSASCILDACPAAVPTAAAGLKSPGQTLKPGSQAVQGLGLGPDDVPWGSAVFVTVILDPAATPVANAVAAAAALAAAHARDRGADDEAGYGVDAWGSATAAVGSATGFSSTLSRDNKSNSYVGVLGFQQLCQQGSGVVVHVRAPAVTGFVSRSQIIGLVQSAVAAAVAAPAAAAGVVAGDQQQQGQERIALQTTLLLQCRLQCCFHSTSARVAQEQQNKHSHQQRHRAAPPPENTAASSSSSSSNTCQSSGFDHASFEVAADDISLFHVKGLGGSTTATASCLCIQGLQLLTSQTQPAPNLTSDQSRSNHHGQLCALLLPKHSKTLGPPGLEILSVSPDSSSSRGGSSSGITSVLLRGATLSMDPGGFSMDWITQITNFIAPITAAAAAEPMPIDSSTTTSSSKPLQQQQQQQQVVVNLQDFGIRCEPCSDTPISHNSSRMAAAFLLEGAHWTLNPKPQAPEHLLLHSLGFYVAAAAARSSLTPSGLTAGMLLLNPRGSSGGLLNPSGGSSSGLGCWDAAAPVDLHGFSLSGAGYHCLAQEGGLAVTVKPAAAAAARDAGDSTTTAGTLEIEVSNSHLTGSLRKDTAALALQLINQWSAHALLRNPPKHFTSTDSTAAAPESSHTAAAAAGAGAAATMHKQQQQQQSGGPGLLGDIDEDAFRVTKRSGSSSSSSDLKHAVSLTSSVSSIGTAATAATSAAAKRQQQMESSVFLSGGWYPTPDPSLASTAAPSVADQHEQQQQQHADGVQDAGSIGVTAAADRDTDHNGTAGGADVPAEGQQRQQQQQQQTIDLLHDWGLDGTQLQQPQQQQWQQQERRGLLSLLDADYPPMPPAAAATDGWQHDLDAADDDDGSSPFELESTGLHDSQSNICYNWDDGLLAASILAQLPSEAAAAAAAGQVPEPVPVVLDDFFLNPDSLQPVTEEGLGFSGLSSLDDIMATSDDEYDIISPRAAAEAAAAAVRARRTAAAMSSGVAGLGSAVCDEQAAAGIWYAAAAAAAAPDSAADACSSACSSQRQMPTSPAAAAAGTKGTVGGSTAAVAAGFTPRTMTMRVQEDYVTPGSYTPERPASPTGAAAASDNGAAAAAMGGGDCAATWQQSAPAAVAAAAAHSQAPMHKAFVSPWSRVLSHPIFQHLLPLDPTAPRPVTKIVFKGISGMFVLHDRGAVGAAAGSSSSSRRMRVASGGTGGRLELEVDGGAARLEIYPPGHCHVSRMTLALGSIEVRDCRRAAAAAHSSSSTGSSVAAAAAATAGAAKAAASAAAAAAAAGHGPRRVAAAAVTAGAAWGSGGSSSSNAQGSSTASAGNRSSSSSKWCRVLSVRRPGTQGGARISRGSSSTTAATSTSAAAVAAAKGTHTAADRRQQQQQPLLGGMLQGWPAAVLAPGSLLPAAAVVLETVKPDPNADDDAVEYRLGVAVLPIRLKLKQELVAFLVAFAAAVSDAVAAVENPLVAAMAAAAAAAEQQQQSGAGVGVSGPDQHDPAAGPTAAAVQPPFFQKVIIWGTGVSVDYCPRRVDIAALRDGDFLELLNLVPWGGVDLVLNPQRFIGLVGWEGLGAAAAAEWLQYVAKTQAHKFLTGVAPIRSVIKVTGAVAALLSGPAAIMQDALAGAVTAATRGVTSISNTYTASGSSSSSGAGSSSAQQLQQRLQQVVAAVAIASRTAATANKQQQQLPLGPAVTPNKLQDVLKHSTAGFARVLLFEALGLGAGVAAGAEVVLSGGRPVVLPTNTPAGFYEGLRAAAGEVQGGFTAAAEVLAEGLAGTGVNTVNGGFTKPLGQVAVGFVKVAPAAAAAPARGLAAAARTALLGAQNALGPAASRQQRQPQQSEQQQCEQQELESVDDGAALESEAYFL